MSIFPLSRFGSRKSTGHILRSSWSQFLVGAPVDHQNFTDKSSQIVGKGSQGETSNSLWLTRQCSTKNTNKRSAKKQASTFPCGSLGSALQKIIKKKMKTIIKFSP